MIKVQKVSENVSVKKTTVTKKGKVTIPKSAAGIAFRADAKQTATLIKAGRAAASNAIRASKALGLTITYMEKGSIIQELPNGVKSIFTAASDNKKNVPSILLKKGMIFHAKK